VFNLSNLRKYESSRDSVEDVISQHSRENLKHSFIPLLLDFEFKHLEADSYGIVPNEISCPTIAHD
jgi:hypothetical protein